jgi:hypothetical protein
MSFYLREFHNGVMRVGNAFARQFSQTCCLVIVVLVLVLVHVTVLTALFFRWFEGLQQD